MTSGVQSERPASVPHNLEAERAVLGAVLLVGESIAERLATEEGLRPEHFYRPQHGAIFSAMLRMSDRGGRVDVLTVSAELERIGRLDEVGGRAALDALAACAPVAGNAAEYARIVVEEATWRARLRAARQIETAVHDRDEDAFGVAEAMLARADGPEATTYDAERLASDTFDWLAQPGERTDLIKLPWPRLNPALGGGLAPGDVTIVAGWTSAGKSVVVDGILEHAAQAGRRAHLYMNEMSIRDRHLRWLASISRIPFKRLYTRNLSDHERERAVRALNMLRKLGVGFTDCAGWHATDIARHIRRNRWDIAAIDLVNLIPSPPGSDGRTSGADEMSRILNTAARQADCHLVLVAQLNQTRNVGGAPPRPVRRDIRDTGQYANDAANILFIHREYVELDVPGQPGAAIYEPTTDGTLYTDKQRNAEGGGVPVVLNTQRMRFMEVA